MTPAELRVVSDDLSFLAEWGGSMRDGDIRRGSATLRRLLVEGVYGTAWRRAKFEKQPSVDYFDLDSFLKQVRQENVAFALSSGAELRGTQTGPLLVTEVDPSITPDDVAKQMLPFGEPKTTTAALSTFLDAPCAYAFGERITRADVVKYIANVKGGVHLSGSQMRREAELVRRVSAADNRFVVLGTEGLLRELVAIGQDIGRSLDARRLIAAITDA